MPVRLFVGNLPYDATEQELREHFGAIGQLSSVFLPVDRETGRPRGFAFVEFVERGPAEDAVTRLNNQPFRGRSLSVSEARAREDRGPAGPRPAGFGGPRPGGPGGGFSGPRPGGGFGGPRPGGPMGPRPGGPGGPGGFGAPPTEGRARNFGPDAPRRGKAKPKSARRDEGPRGPIPIRGGGRIYDVDDPEEGAEVELDVDLATDEQDDDRE